VYQVGKEIKRITQSNVWTSAEVCVHRAMSGHLQKSVYTEQCLDIRRSMYTQSNVWNSAEVCVYRAMSGHLQKYVHTKQCLEFCRSLCVQSNVWTTTVINIWHNNLPPVIVFTLSWFNGMLLVTVPESSEL